MKPTPLHLLPKGWNVNEAEGREAFQEGRAHDSHGFGESTAGKDFERAWRAAERIDRGDVR